MDVFANDYDMSDLTQVPRLEENFLIWDLVLWKRILSIMKK